MSIDRDESLACVYCVAHGRAAPRLARAPLGLPGTKRPRAVSVGAGLWLVLAEAPATRYGERAIAAGLRDIDWVGACAAGHERVVEYVARRHTVVPAKLFTLFASERRALADARRMQARLARIAKRVGGCAEWGVRVHVDERAARASARRRATEQSSRSGSGKGFLLMKKAEHEGVDDTLRSARREANHAFDAVSATARESLRRPAVTRELAARVLLDAVFLVPTTDARTFTASVRRASASLAKNGCIVTLTGPWPPYHFVASAPGARR